MWRPLFNYQWHLCPTAAVCHLLPVIAKNYTYLCNWGDFRISVIPTCSPLPTVGCSRFLFIKLRCQYGTATLLVTIKSYKCAYLCYNYRWLFNTGIDYLRLSVETNALCISKLYLIYQNLDRSVYPLNLCYRIKVLSQPMENLLIYPLCLPKIVFVFVLCVDSPFRSMKTIVHRHFWQSGFILLLLSPMYFK